jgi:serine/threonine protein kinase
MYRKWFNGMFYVGKLFFKNKDFENESLILDILNDNYIPQTDNLKYGKESIVKNFGSIRGNNTEFLLLEYLCLDNGYLNLYDLIEKSDGLSCKQTLLIFRNILYALKYIHSRGVYHGDIKAENIMINCNTGNVKLIDFGSSGYLENKNNLVTLNYGTKIFCAPEIFKFKKHNPFKSDLWSLGCLLYTIHTSKFAYVTQNECIDFRYDAIVNKKHIFPKKFSDMIKPIVKGLLCIDSYERFTIDETISEVNNSLLNFSDVDKIKLDIMVEQNKDNEYKDQLYLEHKITDDD